MSRIEVKSEVTGTVFQIEKAVGDTVEEGDEILILESMKMEIPVLAPCGGTQEKGLGHTRFPAELDLLRVDKQGGDGQQSPLFERLRGLQGTQAPQLAIPAAP